MKKTIVYTFLLIVLIPAFLKADTKDYCSNKWPDDYSMREYCINQQAEANHELFRIAGSEGLVKNERFNARQDGGDKEKIIYRCMSKWENSRFNTYDYTMVVYCINQQLEAYSKTGQSSEKSQGIEGFCADRWPNDYRMREYCTNQQTEANHELFKMAESEGLVKNGTFSAKETGGAKEKIIYRCLSKWGNARFNTYDYKMVIYCIKKGYFKK